VIRNIIVPLDGSTLAESALRVAYGAAERAGATVTAIRVSDSPNDDAAAALGAAVERFADSAPTAALVLDGPPAERLLEVSEANDTILCMATHGRSGISRLVLGSVAEEILRRSTAPIIVVGPNGAVTPLRSERARMVVCTDGSAAAATVLNAAESLASNLDLRCDVVHVTGPDEDVSTDLHSSPRPRHELAGQQCARYCEQLAGLGIRADPIVLNGSPARAVTYYASAHHAAFIAVATHGHSALARLALGSTASNIIRHAPCPVIIERTTEHHLR
jgi:nucleotide-binding universal stress UspA family protein